MTRARHLTWENFERDILRAGVPADHPIAGSPRISLYFRPELPQLGITIDLAAVRPVRPSPFREIDITIQSTPRGPALAISGANVEIFRQLFPVLLETADAVQLEGADPFDAAEVAVARVANAIRLVPQLSIEKTVGLWGELWVLRKLVSARGAEGLRSWFGWQADRHDFRIGNLELEVKTTLGTPAVHLINGLGQLEASEGATLCIISIQLSRAEERFTLSQQVSAIEALLASAPLALSTFRNALNDSGVSASDLASSRDAFRLRSYPELVPMTRALPQLTSTTLGKVVDAAAVARLTEIHYGVNVDGLGLPWESARFAELVQWMTPDD